MTADKKAENQKKGLIVKSLSGFYYVEEDSTGEVYRTRARGQFRITDTTPLVGDRALFLADNREEGFLVEIMDRKNVMERPPVANVDSAFIVNSVAQPSIQVRLIDRLLVYVESLDIQPIVYFTKLDLVDDEEEQSRIRQTMDLYRQIGYPVFDSLTVADHLDDLSRWTRDQVMVVMGQSGVGKSTFINQLIPGLDLETQPITRSMNRGRHTTRQVELHDGLGGKIADTPGFSAVSLDHIADQDLDCCFPEMREPSRQCRFRGCSHTHEPQCAVKTAVADGQISQSRYDSYTEFLAEIQQTRPKY